MFSQRENLLAPRAQVCRCSGAPQMAADPREDAQRPVFSSLGNPPVQLPCKPPLLLPRDSCHCWFLLLSLIGRETVKTRAETCPVFVLHLLLVEAALADVCNTDQVQLGLFRAAGSRGLALCSDMGFCMSCCGQVGLERWGCCLWVSWHRGGRAAHRKGSLRGKLLPTSAAKQHRDHVQVSIRKFTGYLLRLEYSQASL